MVRRLILLALLAGALVLPGTPAWADGRVSVANDQGQARIDPTYATTLRVSGSGFQAISGGHGGIYVVFGTVKPGWQPSRGGATGSDYFYVPDSESKNNQGFQRYVAFPGSDTAGSANGGTMSASGAWSTELVVPGAVFKAYDRGGQVRTIDCRTVTCGVITIGAHGVSNSHNETFTPVTVGAVSGTGSTDASTAPTTAPTAAPTAETGSPDTPGAAPTGGSTERAQKTGPATLEVDRASAVGGNVLAFSGSGLPAGAQVSAVFDDGAAAAGPFAVGADGRLVGVLTLPTDVEAGTHELRLYGIDDPPSVKFAVQPAVSAEPSAADETSEAAATQPDGDERAAWVFAGAAALVLLLAVARLGWHYRRSRRATA